MATSTTNLSLTKPAQTDDTNMIDDFNDNMDLIDAGVALLGANSDITSLTGLTTPLGAAYGGTGVANAAGETITLTGGFALNLTLTEATGVTLPASGTLLANVSEDTTPQLGGTLDLNSQRITGGSLGSEIDVSTNGYGVQWYYSGDNQDVTALRSRAVLKTTDASTKTAQGAVLQASNSNGIDAGVLNGVLIEAIGKSDSTASTITTMRGALIGTEWNAKETITDMKTLHVRTHTRDSATEGYISGTGYLIYAENEAVGGNGQQLDAGFYLKATNVSTPYAFDYGIDLTGASGEIATADIKFSFGCIFTNYAGDPNTNVTATKGSLCIDTANGDLYVNTDASTAWSALK